MKYKKQIVMICLITFLFLPFQKYEEPKAEILTLTAGTIIACAALATACGVVVSNPDVLKDIGTRVYDGIKDIEGVFETVGDKVKINVTSSLLEYLVPWLIENVPSSPTYVEQNIISNGGVINLTKVLNFDAIGKHVYFKVFGDGNTKITVKIRPAFNPSGYSYRGIFYPTSTSNSFEVYSTPNSSNSISFSCANFYANNFDLECTPCEFWIEGAVSVTDSVCIPYGEEINELEDVSLEKPKEYFPAGSGSISVPVDTPLSNYNPSVDSPITVPSDLVGDGISADVDTSTDTGAIDKPNVDVGETPTTGDSLWDTLLSWLSSLFAPLTALLEWIGDMINSILDTLKNLIVPEEMEKINFGPLYFSFADKFPFCIPFDLIRMIKEFQATDEKPIFHVDMSPFSSNKYSRGEVGFTIDLTKFDDLIKIVRTLTLISFIFTIAFKTRDIIKG